MLTRQFDNRFQPDGAVKMTVQVDQRQLRVDIGLLLHNLPKKWLRLFCHETGMTSFVADGDGPMALHPFVFGL